MKNIHTDSVWGIREKGTTSIWERLIPGKGKAFMLYLLFGNRWDAENFIRVECSEAEQKVLEIIRVDLISEVN